MLNADDGTLYFDEKRIADTEYRGPLATTASVVHGVTAFAAIVSGKLEVSEQNVLKLFFVLVVFPHLPPPTYTSALVNSSN